MSGGATTITPRTRERRTFSNVAQRLSVPVAWIITIAVFGALRPDSFLTVGTFSSILGTDAVLVFVTLGLLITLRSGDYDLSVAAVLTLSAMVVTLLNVQEHLPIVYCILVTAGIGTCIGFINGCISVFLEIDSFIVTLGVGTFVSGVVLWISNDTTFSGVSTGLVNAVVGDTFLSVPLEFYYALALCLILWYMFEYTGVGRRHLFVGKGREVARLSGIPVARVRIWAFALTGLVSSLAGVLYAGTAGGADPSSGLTYLLPAFAAAFLGSTTILPGQFNPVGAFVSAYFLVTGITGLEILGVQNYVTDLFYGGALVVAVAATQIIRRGMIGTLKWRWSRATAEPTPAGVPAESPTERVK